MLNEEACKLKQLDKYAELEEIDNVKISKQQIQLEIQSQQNIILTLVDKLLDTGMKLGKVLRLNRVQYKQYLFDYWKQNEKLQYKDLLKYQNKYIWWKDLLLPVKYLEIISNLILSTTNYITKNNQLKGQFFPELQNLHQYINAMMDSTAQFRKNWEQQQKNQKQQQLDFQNFKQINRIKEKVDQMQNRNRNPYLSTIISQVESSMQGSTIKESSLKQSSNKFNITNVVTSMLTSNLGQSQKNQQNSINQINDQNSQQLSQFSQNQLYQNQNQSLTNISQNQLRNNNNNSNLGNFLNQVKQSQNQSILNQSITNSKMGKKNTLIQFSQMGLPRKRNSSKISLESPKIRKNSSKLSLESSKQLSQQQNSQRNYYYLVSGTQVQEQLQPKILNFSAELESNNSGEEEGNMDEFDIIQPQIKDLKESYNFSHAPSVRKISSYRETQPTLNSSSYNIIVQDSKEDFIKQERKISHHFKQSPKLNQNINACQKQQQQLQQMQITKNYGQFLAPNQTFESGKLEKLQQEEQMKDFQQFFSTHKPPQYKNKKQLESSSILKMSELGKSNNNINKNNQIDQQENNKNIDEENLNESDSDNVIRNLKIKSDNNMPDGLQDGEICEKLYFFKSKSMHQINNSLKSIRSLKKSQQKQNLEQTENLNSNNNAKNNKQNQLIDSQNQGSVSLLISKIFGSQQFQNKNQQVQLNQRNKIKDQNLRKNLLKQRAGGGHFTVKLDKDNTQGFTGLDLSELSEISNSNLKISQANIAQSNKIIGAQQNLLSQFNNIQNNHTNNSNNNISINCNNSKGNQQFQQLQQQNNCSSIICLSHNGDQQGDVQVDDELKTDEQQTNEKDDFLEKNKNSFSYNLQNQEESQWIQNNNQEQNQQQNQELDKVNVRNFKKEDNEISFSWIDVQKPNNFYDDILSQKDRYK
ncbi:hypothetical protein PPERSA_02770 [Pseudocohnilembus persalinus]|uniref:Uncharacterized protein n=1 Tax=Pseudocohnilembus persalinus TaxID=266149 RepID=A0A0V0Q8V2_PSEPJ|nr:hypothetical protein PPERSA_02770 [Pseudocohnilembus persalinus]|eukprot:KRW98622.1 hypothetical protein PPERSA_02770 [Pseudocohnilembus persalinus]